MSHRSPTTATLALATLAGAAAAQSLPLPAQRAAHHTSHALHCDPLWSDVGGGITLGIFNIVYSTRVWEVGGTEYLFVSGIFEQAGPTPAANIARWDGEVWSPVGGGLSRGGAPALGLCVDVFDDGAGEALYCGGVFSAAGGIPAANIARWNGINWSPVGAGMDQNVWDFAVWDDDGPGPRPPALYACGQFTTAGGVAASCIARWNGQNWSPLGSGLAAGTQSFLAGYTLEALSDRLLVGGIFGLAGGAPTRGLASWNGSQWSAFGPPLDNPGFNTSVQDIAVYDGGFGPQVHVTGSFISSQGTILNRIARFDGAAWQPLGGGLVGGGGGGLAVWDKGGGEDLWVGGTFTSAGGGTSARIARWDGKSWHSVGAGFSGGSLVDVANLTPWNDPQGSALYAGGLFGFAGNVPVSSIARLSACAVECYPDCDTSTGPAILDIFDFLCFQNRYDAGSPYACDCDTTTGPAICDIFDFLCFQNAFDAGCP